MKWPFDDAWDLLIVAIIFTTIVALLVITGLVVGV